MAGWYLFRVSDGSGVHAAPLREQLLAIPGIKLDERRGLVVKAPENAAWLIERTLTANGARFELACPAGTLFQAEHDLAKIAELHEWVPNFLLPYQREGIAFALSKGSAALHHAPGAGKSLSAIVWALAVEGTIVFVTRAAARRTIAREFERYTTVRPIVLTHAIEALRLEERPLGWITDPLDSAHRIYVRTGSGGFGEMTIASIFRAGEIEIDVCSGMVQGGLVWQRVRRAIMEPGSWERGYRYQLRLDSPHVEAPRAIILGWETLPAHIDGLVALKPTSIVLDEVHRAKGRSRFSAIPTAETNKDGSPKIKFVAKRNIANAAMRLSRAAERRLATTATPIKDRVRDLWAQLDLVHPGEWGRYRDWAIRYCDAGPNRFNAEALDDRGESNADELAARLSFVRHHVPRSVSHRDLPPKRRQVSYISKADQDPPSSFAKELREAQKRGPNAIVETRLAEAASRKRTVLSEIVADSLGAKSKIVIFTGRHHDCEKLGQLVTKLAKDTGAQVWVAHGGHGIKERDAIREAYMASKGPAVIVGTGDAWGESISLHDTDLALIAMLPYTPGQLDQWEGRFTRHGQHRPVLIQYLVAEGTADEHVASILLDKLPAVEKVIGDAEAGALGRDLSGAGEPGEIEKRLVEKILGLGGLGDLADENSGTRML